MKNHEAIVKLLDNLCKKEQALMCYNEAKHKLFPN